MIYIIKVGFDAGDGTNFYSFPTAFTADIINIGRSTNSGVTGRYVFRIDGQVIDVQPITESGMYINEIRLIRFSESIYILPFCHFVHSDLQKLFIYSLTVLS